MLKLCQIVAIEKGEKSTTEAAVTAAYHRVQKNELFSGRTRTYEPKDDDGEHLPSESQKVIAHVDEVVEEFATQMGKLFDVTATKVYANCSGVARANVVFNETVIVADAPVEYLLFLEKRLIDMQTFLKKLPTLDPAYDWTFDVNSGDNLSTPVLTNRSQKVAEVMVKAPATDKHPAQTEMITKDVVVGTWTTTLRSGSVPATKVREWQEKVSQLQTAVKMAREEANSIEIDRVSVADNIMNFIFH